MTWYPRCQGWCHRPETVSLASSCIRPRGPGARNRVPKVWNRAQVFQTQLFEAKRLFSMDVRWFSKAVFKSVTSNEPHSCSSNQSLRFHNHCNYIVVLGIGVTWHSHMSNASKGCHEISRVLSSYAKPGRRCINAMWQYQIGCLHSCDIHHSVFLLSKEVTLRDPFKTHGPGRVWTRRGGGRHVKGSLQPETLDVIDHCLFPKTAPNTFPKESQLQLAS